MAHKEIREAPASPYKHTQESVQRPDVGVEGQFAHKKPPRTYRYDSSLAPELSWDESADRAFAEWLLGMIAEAAEKGVDKVFAEPQVWQGTEERFTSLSQCAARLRSLTKPFLDWSGKAERQQVSVPTLPLFVHERHSTQAILETLQSHKARGTTLDLFGDIDLDIADKLDAYEHKGPWTNRLVLGDSLQVMNSLLEYEGMGGQVQMLYFDPPYGVKFGSNFQPFVRKNSVKHGSDDEMIRDPEMVKAYRDTWELGLHSYLTYLRDRLMLAKEMLSDSGSLFVQISDDNIHHIREVLDEVFPSGFVSQISFQTTSGFEFSTLPTVGDFLLWYAKDKEKVRYNKVFHPQPVELGKGNARWVVTAQVLAVKILWDSAQRYPRDARVLLCGRRVSQLTMPLLRTATGKLPRCGPKSARATGTDFHSMGWSSTASTMIVYENGSAVGEPVPGELTRT